MRRPWRAQGFGTARGAAATRRLRQTRPPADGQLEPSGEPVPVGVVLLAPRQADQGACSGFQALLQERSVVQFQQPIGDMHSAVRIDADQVVVERRMVDFRERYAFGYDGLAEKLIAIVMMCAEPSRRSSGKMLIAHRWVVPPPER
jgi:hypothetical protein